MKSIKTLITPLTATALVAAFTATAHAAPFLVGNRGASSVSVILNGDDVFQNRPEVSRVVGQVDAMTLGFEIEPMYFVRLNSDEVALGDRKTNQVLTFRISDDGKTLSPLKSHPISKGAFHMSGHFGKAGRDRVESVIFVATDVDKGVDILARSHSTIGGADPRETHQRFELPAEFQTGKPHDVIGDGKFVFLTVSGIDEAGRAVDKLLKIDRGTLQVVDQRTFTLDIHLLSLDEKSFVVVEQENGRIRVIDRDTFQDLDAIVGPAGVHGVAAIGNTLFVTDINAAPNEDALLAYRLQKKGSLYALNPLGGIPLPTKVAHNIAVSAVNGTPTLLVTHSGAQSSAVSVVRFDEGAGRLQFVKTLFTGTNPFGVIAL